MKASLARRIDQLEKHPQWQPPGPPTAEERPFEKKLEQLLSEIDDKYARLILADLKQAHTIEQCSGLTCAFGNRVLDHFLFGMPLR